MVAGAGAGALCRYSKPLLDSWLSLQFALGKLVGSWWKFLGLILLLFEKPPSQIFESSNSPVRTIQLANEFSIAAIVSADGGSLAPRLARAVMMSWLTSWNAFHHVAFPFPSTLPVLSEPLNA